jgi:hypothetical protein
MARRAACGDCWVGAAVLAALSCARFGYESLPFEPHDSNVTHGGAVGGSGGANAGGSGGFASGGSAAWGAAAASGSGSTDAGDTGGSDAVDAGNSNEDAGGATAAGCGAAVPTATWAFASDLESWRIETDAAGTGSLNWTAATGDPAPGALQLDATVTTGTGPGNVRVYLDQGSTRDLTGKVIYARVLLEGGSGVSAKVFVQSGSGYVWADGDDVLLDAQRWNCVSFDPQSPSVSVPGFDPADVRRIGVFFFGDASPRLYIDQVNY